MEEAIKFAKEHGYEKIKKLGLYDGYVVYNIIFSPDKKGNYPCIGYPRFILEKDKKFMIKIDDDFKIIDHFFPDDESDK